MRDSVRARKGTCGGGWRVNLGGVFFALGGDSEGGATMMAMGDEGTGGRTPRGGGLRFPLGLEIGGGGISKVERIAVAGGRGVAKEVFHAGADGGGRLASMLGRAVEGVNVVGG